MERMERMTKFDNLQFTNERLSRIINVLNFFATDCRIGRSSLRVTPLRAYQNLILISNKLQCALHLFSNRYHTPRIIGMHKRKDECFVFVGLNIATERMVIGQ